MTAMSGVSEKRTEIFAGDAKALRDVGEVAVTTGFGEIGTGTMTGNVTVISGVSEKKRKEKNSW